MLSKFSVKKPMTVFVAVVMVLVLGVVAFLRMTPDLLPNLDLPYAVILTPYIGQTPETVEKTVTDPLERSVAVIDGVKTMSSQSADNYSMLLIQFNDGVNMDTATVDVRSALDTLSDQWDDAVGAPYLIKVNPSVLPVAMTAVDYAGKDRLEISEFVENELLNKIKAIDGVASVTDKGLLTQKEHIVLSQKKLDKLNKKINAALDEQFADAEDQLAAAREELENNIEAAENGAATISDSIEEINEGRDALADQLAEAQTKASDGKTKLLSAKMELLDQKSALTQNKTLLETGYQALLTIRTGYMELLDKKQELLDRITVFEKARQLAEDAKAGVEGIDVPEQIDDALDKATEEANKLLAPYGVTIDTLDESLDKAKKALAKLDSSIDDTEKKLKELGTDTTMLDTTLSTMAKNIRALDKGIGQIDTAIEGLDAQTLTVDEALSTISKQQSGADFQMSSALSALIAKQSELTAATAQLENARAELDKSVDTVKDQKKQAKSMADANKTVTMDNVAAILTAQSFSMPAGYVTDDSNNRYLVRVGDEVADEKELKKLALFDTKIDGIGVIRLGDVADIFVADNSDEIYAKINGEDGVILSLTKQSNIATSTVCDNINNDLRALEEKYPGLEFNHLYNQGDYIHIIVNSVLQNLLMGAVLAILILFLFLRDIKPTVIVAASIPISVVFAIVLMYFSGVTLNVISLSGLAIGVGMLVDNSVVVIENIYRLRGLGYSAISAAMNGAKQVAGAIAASTLTTICVFVPIVFVEGITRQLFVDMALTIAYSLLASLAVALTLVPAMSQRMLRTIRQKKKSGDGKIMRGYERSLRFVIRHKVLAILVVIGLLFASFALTLTRGFSFMPSMSNTQVQIDVELDANATFEDTVEAAEQVNKVMLQHDEFDTVGVTVGSSAGLMGLSVGGAQTDAGKLMAYGVLKSDYIKQGVAIGETIKKELSHIKGKVDTGSGAMSSMSTLIGDGSVSLSLYADELPTLHKTARDIAGQLEALDCIDTADSGVGATSPEIKVTVNKQKAAAKGLTVAQVFQQVAAAVADDKTSATLKADGKSIDVVVVKDDSQKITASEVGKINLTYTNKEGSEKKTSLSSVAEISKAESMNIIGRSDQKRYLALSATVKKGYTLTDATNQAKALMADYPLPSGVSYEFTGADEATMEAVQQLMLMLLLGVIMIYLIMVAQFQSLKSPFIIMFTIPLAFTGGFLGLLLTGFDLSVISIIGFIMLCGIIVNNGIVLVDYINRLRIGGTERIEAIVEAGKTRMRPILITALTTVLGLSVVALGIGTGAEMMQPLAIVSIGGLLYATLMTLYIIPAIYDAFHKKELRSVSAAELAEIKEE